MTRARISSGVLGAIFAESVIRPNKATIAFDGFDPLLQRICDVINAYTAHPTYP
ncbi:hypothetical protein AB6806_19545 [Bosea sp. RCC_152_1]|uniref:hypothetical protein n=1 Tax=Bosea sp. RCC_152_1 TaxID=3239228 RepID=UPI003525F81E